MQPALYNARGDVLVILDCCHAALKTRGKKEGKMELLAACGSGSRVPAPGKLSFTSILTRQLKEKARLGNSISVKSLHTHLWNDKLELTGTDFLGKVFWRKLRLYSRNTCLLRFIRA
jgi:hypothetical protein